MRDFIKGIFQRSGRGPEDLPDDLVAGFLRVLEQARIQEMPCSQVFALLDEYVERESRGQPAARLMPLLREHLDLCPHCCEEYEALLSILAGSTDTAPAREV